MQLTFYAYRATKTKIPRNSRARSAAAEISVLRYRLSLLLDGKSLREAAMIRKVKGGYQVMSEKGDKNLGGPYKTKAEAAKRLRQVEFFKHRKG